jgi:hypothetical protein
LAYRGADFTDIPVTFNGSGTQYITNDNPADNTYTIFDSLTVNIGSSQTDELIVDITGTLNTPTDSWLTLQNGTFKYEHDDDLTISETSTFTIPSQPDYTSTQLVIMFILPMIMLITTMFT